MNHYQITAFVNKIKLRNMTQTEIKKLASEIIGDGQTPNMWFVTYGPYVTREVGDYEYSAELIDGYTEDEACTSGPFESYEEAVDCFNEIELDIDYGIGQVFIEDRQVGTVREKFLKEIVRVDYVEEEIDDSKLFYEKTK